MSWALPVSFIGRGLWIPVPGKLDDDKAITSRTHFGVFGTMVVTVFNAEMGDKTEVATVALAARFHDFFGVVAGTTLDMMIANVPSILLGDRFAHPPPTGLVHGSRRWCSSCWG